MFSINFKRIRFKAILKKRYLRLAKYAFVEVCLIIFGIYIGLRINDYHNKIVLKEKELEHYRRVLENVTDDKNELDSLIVDSNDKITKTKNLIKYIHSDSNDLSVILNAYLNVLRANNFIPDKTGFETIKYSGMYANLNDVKTKEKIERFYSQLERDLTIIRRNRKEVIDRVFSYEFCDAIGWQEFEYVKESLGRDVSNLYPSPNWHMDKSSSYFRSFKSDLLFFIVMREREIQLNKKIRGRMNILIDELKTNSNRGDK